ncbi:putative DNA-directed RNA polymerase II 14.5 kDa polypeptide [Tilletiaria anomala UBC 951]|uniref:DNA-directed RNA polymerase II subunit RPB9 n=1 Tax=Tilletiaria anomala (strain ATCC 24038 / CBS 436.72 / UBC 951) TaxID=1037660 RepID=A0A066VKM6_TILAU|nr:putative DNA-directed RNA polymerase II 14.5 kDa polypeptide [Tilletiaria anomala UBC 951]KDN42287.1 putative DNA-directed RNA polymerase II 14.5 kDa polypeptide [Tilletiaria anomala UBC 951]
MASLKFCQECNNLLYPEEDRTNHVLLYSCRNCDYREEAGSQLVFRNDLISVTQEQPGVIDNITKDPTLQRVEQKCPYCGNQEAVCFQDQSKRIFNRMILFFCCCNCEKLFQDPEVSRKAGTNTQVNPEDVTNLEAF